jgi:MscS family membrane protein
VLRKSRPIVLWCVCALFWGKLEAQPKLPGAGAPPSGQLPAPEDPLGRTTPRGTVLGFIKASHKGDDEAAVQYLNTRLRGSAAINLAHQLFAVLDRRLPARMNKLSDSPAGSLAFVSKPNQDLVGTIKNADEQVDIIVEKATPAGGQTIWLFSKETLDDVPDLFADLDTQSVEDVLPKFLSTKIAQAPLFEWLAFLVGLPSIYVLTTFAGRLMSLWVGRWRRRIKKNPLLPNPVLMRPPGRFLTLAIVIVWALAKFNLPYLARQFWSGVAVVAAILAFTWWLILATARAERLLRLRLERSNNTAASSVLRLGRRMIEVLIVFTAVLAIFLHFGINPTAALAGLGVGGIAVALAAQKTLENVIGGISLIFDQAVRVGDWVNTAGVSGGVEYIGLRSTRIRTVDRTLVCVPNGQLANATIENVSLRDKFWYNQRIALSFDTTGAQLCSIAENVETLMKEDKRVQTDSVRVRLLRLTASALDIEIAAYVFATTFPEFLKIQQELLTQAIQAVEGAGVRFGFETRKLYLASDSGREPQSQQWLDADGLRSPKPIASPRVPEQ